MHISLWYEIDSYYHDILCKQIVRTFPFENYKTTMGSIQDTFPEPFSLHSFLLLELLPLPYTQIRDDKEDVIVEEEDVDEDVKVTKKEGKK